MRDIKRITIDHKGLPFFDEDGVYVSYEDCAKIIEDLNNTENDEIDANCQISDLKRQLNALAAENAALMHFALGLYYPDGTSSVNEHDLGKTPATDAYLNAVRAEGVEMFGSALKDKYEGIAYELIGNYETNGEEDRISDEGEIQDAFNFAAILRAGEQS